jgi:hypothetical protein
LIERHFAVLEAFYELIQLLQGLLELAEAQFLLAHLWLPGVRSESY